MPISSLSGVLLHLEGTSLGADATSVSTWPDLGPLGNDADLNGATAPVVDDGATPTGAKAATFSALSSPLTTLYGLGSWAASASSLANETYSATWATTSSGQWISQAAPATTAQWWRIHYRTATVVTSFEFGSGDASRAPSSFTIEGSNDASTWTTLHTETGLSGYTAAQTFSFSNSTAYHYYHIHITAVAGGGSNLASIRYLTVNGSSLTADAGEVWMLVKAAGDATGSGWPFDATDSRTDTRYPYLNGDLYDEFGAKDRAVYAPTMNVGTWRILRQSVTSSGVHQTYLDGVSQVTRTIAAADRQWRDGITIGWGQYGSGRGFQGQIAAVLILDHVTDSTEQATIEDEWGATYLAPAMPAFESPASSGAEFEPFSNPVAEFAASSPSDATFTTMELPGLSARARSAAAFDPVGSAHVTYPATTVYFTAPSPSRGLTAPALRPQAPPATVASWPVAVEAHTMPALSEARQTVTKFADYQPLTGALGRFQIWVDGQPITYLRDVPTIVQDYSSADPYGDDGARFLCKQIHPWDELGTGDLSMFDMDSDPPVDIAFEDEAGNLTHVWDGFLASQGDDTTATDEGRTFTAEGTLKQAAHWPWTPPAYMEPTDPGVVFARAMNGTPNRRFTAFVEVETGLPPITYRGSQNQSILDYALEVLSKMTASDGRQWAPVKVGPRNYQLALKATLDDYDAAIVKGAEGVEARLVQDETMRADGYFGQGIAPNGGQWGNFFFPGLDLFIPPPYPYTDTTQTIYIGDTDAGTDTGDGVTVAQRRLVELGYAVAVDGTFNSADAAAVTQMQTDFGLLVDGRIGPQTWSSLFSPGVNEVDLGRIRLPLVSKPWVMEYLYAANGAVAGPNPAWDRDPVPHMPNINFGSDITKSEATVLARKMLEQNGDAAWTGRIDLLTDLVAPDGVTPISRFLVREGWRIKVIGHDGDTIVRVGEASKDELNVSLSVDQKARDALTLDAIAARDRAALRETKPRPGNPSKISALIRDHVTQFEDESKAGRIPAYPVNGNVGLWSVFPIFVSQTGSIAKFVMSARNVTTTFCCAIFGKPIQPQVLAGYEPDPINDGSGWRDHYDTLVLDHALIAVYGEPGALGGYAPRVQADGGPITGDLFDDSGFPFESQVGGYLWVAVFASASTIVSGRAFPGVPQ